MFSNITIYLFFIIALKVSNQLFSFGKEDENMELLNPRDETYITILNPIKDNL